MHLLAFPFRTFGELASARLVVRVWCLGCRGVRELDAGDRRWRDRRFAGAQLRCRGCGAPGALSIVPPHGERVTVGGGDRFVELQCARCVPPWEIREMRPGRPPWPALGSGQSFACPACGRALAEVWHGGPGVPFSEGFRERYGI